VVGAMSVKIVASSKQLEDQSFWCHFLLLISSSVRYVYHVPSIHLS
jgi:hypothetical protein